MDHLFGAWGPQNTYHRHKLLNFTYNSRPRAQVPKPRGGTQHNEFWNRAQGAGVRVSLGNLGSCPSWEGSSELLLGRTSAPVPAPHLSPPSAPGKTALTGSPELCVQGSFKCGLAGGQRPRPPRPHLRPRPRPAPGAAPRLRPAPAASSPNSASLCGLIERL